ncbi:hypothetical protein [Oscillibacter sp. GMB15532]|uniref:YkvI family membrane protein n=1 Tax=Oscillibacter sp. GMB15532 TaxID=3230022 RepID=UPI0034DECA0C
MANKRRSRLLRILIPGFVFQSVVIGGGYGTGAEIREYFLSRGLAGGLLGMAVTLGIWSVLCAVTFEFSRTFRTYDYKSMMTKLLGKADFLYEICYIVMLLIVLGVVTATAGSMVTSLTGGSKWIGVAVLSLGIIVLVIKGTAAIENVLTFWSYVLYAVYILFMIVVFVRFGSNLPAAFASRGLAGSDWLMGGAKYAFYNLGIIPALLYTVRQCHTRREAVISGLLAGVIGIVPAGMLLLTMGTMMGACMVAEVPIIAVFQALDINWLFWLFEIVLFGTLIETGTGFIKALDDRIEHSIAASGKPVSGWVRPGVAIGCMVMGVLFSTFGLVDLIAQGYGTISWGFLLFFVVPMMTIGIYKILRHGRRY